MTSTTVTGPSATAPTRAIRVLAVAPERIVLVGIALALSAGFWVNVGFHHWYVVVPTAVAVAAAGWRFAVPRAIDKATATASAFSLGGVAVWLLWNLPLAAEFLVVRRDPGFLALSGLWLIDHGSTDMPLAGAGEAAALQGNVIPDAAEAWNRNDDVVQPQGAKMLPAVIAIGGWVAGWSGVLTANVYVGALGLLAMYVLARRLMGPYGAMVPAVALALSASHWWFSRAAYTEPLTMLLLLAALWCAWIGVRRNQAIPLVFAAIISSATTLVRIDGALFAIGVAAGTVFALTFARGDGIDRRRTLAHTLVFLGIQGVVVWWGYWALERWSAEYLARLAHRAEPLTTWYVRGLAALAALSVMVWLWRSFLQPRLKAQITADAWPKPDRWMRVGGIAAAAGTGSLWIFFASRPWWQQVEKFADGDFHAPYVEWLQERSGLEVNGARSYDESTVTWLSYYLGWPLLWIGVAGLALVAYRALSGRAEWAILAAGFLAPALPYLWSPSIVPDQQWAIRRLSTSAIPGLILAAALLWLWAVNRWRLRNADGSHQAWSLVVAFAATSGTLTSFVSVAWHLESPIAANHTLVLIEQGGARAQVTTLCAYIDGQPTILVGTSSHFGVVRAGCEAPVVLSFGTVTPENVRGMETSFGETPVIITQNPDKVVWQGGDSPAHPTFCSTMYMERNRLGMLPRGALSQQHYRWYVGYVQPDGTAVPAEETYVTRCET